MKKVGAIAAAWRSQRHNALMRVKRVELSLSKVNSQLDQLAEMQQEYQRRRAPSAMPSAADLADLIHLDRELEVVLAHARKQQQQADALLRQCRAQLMEWDQKLLGLDRLGAQIHQRAATEKMRKERRQQQHAPRPMIGPPQDI